MSQPRLTYIGLDEFKALASSGEAPSDVKLIKGYVAEHLKAENGGRRATFVISTGAVDGDRDTVAIDGWDLERYLKNPVVLFAHKYDQLPVGKGLSIVKSAGQLKATVEFDSHPLAEAVYQSIKGGFLRGASVGFKPKVSQWNEERRGVDFIEQELLEFSMVPVPSNPEALLETAKSFAGAMAAGIDVGPIVQALGIARSVVRLKDLDGLLQDVDIDKGVVPANVSSSKAPEDKPWKAPSLSDFTSKGWGDLTDAEKRKIAGHFAWAASMPPAKFGDLKLPHHDPKSGAVVWHGVAAAMGALLGARGGVSIPAADKAKVKAHLAAHYRQFGKDVPKEAPVAIGKSGRVLSAANKELLEEAIKTFKRAHSRHKDAGESMEECDSHHESGGEALEECQRALEAMKSKGASGTDPDGLNDAVAALKRAKRFHKDYGEAMDEADGHHKDAGDGMAEGIKALKDLLAKAEAPAMENEDLDPDESDPPEGSDPDEEPKGHVPVDLKEISDLTAEACKTAVATEVAAALRRATGRLD